MSPVAGEDKLQNDKFIFFIHLPYRYRYTVLLASRVTVLNNDCSQNLRLLIQKGIITQYHLCYQTFNVLNEVHSMYESINYLEQKTEINHG